MGTKKVLVNPEPISDESEKTAEAEEFEVLLQQEYDNTQRFLKENKNNPEKESKDNPGKESKDNPGKEKEGWIQCLMKKHPKLREKVASNLRSILPTLPSGSTERTEDFLHEMGMTDTEQPSEPEKQKTEPKKNH